MQNMDENTEGYIINDSDCHAKGNQGKWKVQGGMGCKTWTKTRRDTSSTTAIATPKAIKENGKCREVWDAKHGRIHTWDTHRKAGPRVLGSSTVHTVGHTVDTVAGTGAST